MNLINSLRFLLASWLVPNKVILKGKFQVAPSFVSNGIQYFEFADIFAGACGRMMEAEAIYNELSMRCSREFLQAHCTAMNNLLTSKSIHLGKISQLNLQLEERLNLIIEGDIFLKLCSIVFFDESEDPAGYDYKYNLEKIARWKKEGIESFFLQMPVQKLLPFSGLSESDLATYIKTGMEVTKAQLENIFTMLSETDKTKDFYKTLLSQRSSE